MRIKLGRMARALEALQLGIPVGYVTTGVAAHAGISDNTIGAAGQRSRCQRRRIEPNHYQLVHARTVAHHPGGRIDRKGEFLLCLNCHIADTEWLSCPIAKGERNEITGLRRQLRSWIVAWLRLSQCRHTQSDRTNATQKPSAPLFRAAAIIVAVCCLTQILCSDTATGQSPLQSLPSNATSDWACSATCCPSEVR